MVAPSSAIALLILPPQTIGQYIFSVVDVTIFKAAAVLCAQELVLSVSADSRSLPLLLLVLLLLLVGCWGLRCGSLVLCRIFSAPLSAPLVAAIHSSIYRGGLLQLQSYGGVAS